MQTQSTYLICLLFAKAFVCRLGQQRAVVYLCYAANSQADRHAPKPHLHSLLPSFFFSSETSCYLSSLFFTLQQCRKLALNLLCELERWWINCHPLPTHGGATPFLRCCSR